MCSQIDVILNSDSTCFELHFDWFGLNHNFELSGTAFLHYSSYRELSVFLKNPTVINIKKVLKICLILICKDTSIN